jgi:hypothetical protein
LIERTVRGKEAVSIPQSGLSYMPIPPALAITPSERQRFNQAVTNTGLDPDAAWNNVINVTASGSIPSNYITTIQVQSVEQLNTIVGVPNSPFQNPTVAHALPVPDEIGAPNLAATLREALGASLSPAQLRHLKRSADAHVFGDSSRATANLALVNKLLYPIAVDVVAAQSLTLEPGATLSLGGNYVMLVLGSLSIGAGAQIASTANTVVNVQVAYSAND